MYTLATVVLFLFCVFSLLRISIAEDTIFANQPITDGQTITSAGGTFELGFFSPGNSKNRYVGIWFRNITQKVVWVANRETPVRDSSGIFMMNRHGVLLVLNRTNHVFWLSNSYGSTEYLRAQLLETGNLVIQIDGYSNQDWLWQSFDHPGDTLLPGMKLGWKRAPGLDRHLSSWKSADDPSAGNFTYGVDSSKFPQLLLRSGSAVKFRAGLPELTQSSDLIYKFVYNDEEIYLTYDVGGSSDQIFLELTPDGNVRRVKGSLRHNRWVYNSTESDYQTQWRDECDTYATCWANGICNIKSSENDQSEVHKNPVCECMNGFMLERKWDRGDWSEGCVRRTPLDCQKGDKFVGYTGIKLPDTHSSWFNENIDLNECGALCLKNCSCTAYANSYVGGSGCLLWFHDLIDIRNLSADGQQVYVRIAASEPGQNALSASSSSFKKKNQVTVISTSITGIVLVSLVLIAFSMLKMRKRQLKGKGK